MIRELRDFLFRGNIISLAIAVIMGAAFTAVVNSLVADIVTPVLSLFGIPDFSSWTIVVTGVGGNPATFAVGRFLNALISFGVVTVAIFFLVVKPMDAMDARLRGSKQDAPPAPTEVELLVEIRDLLRDQIGRAHV